ncbi:MAG: NADH-quinone oxidoreductase subunit C [Zetaproteobacteria bacterium CG12_big_fil_rev_8_21_14_0_65_55_1124]|nr:MAG: NADH dehydrogenase [Zetaproteobacteria bacterium CG1_02_55_237]PIS19278.1 MAG: NADH-quinone oxidoreductase subunit C [Zetaproteobacteria bacterium CG08_land_8_20_14_0_20_55_17]PIW43545.1 MAG: NADH-quinone oxidoreductase subunit C [Zetaproteobacteria bacterium CG12_big_fil_rev_8_21_14_0_65_55_1124]PIY54401.1 MAG: NADH-quinone oxidoreductase subunit C [Zetaproteobacteria bacterium CG_4_10_14_0_8_um_filter_55_43]PIZ39008.1 MAG: NADH-quinone oxidoreductase subunit C [Zetaproteobacteria bact
MGKKAAKEQVVSADVEALKKQFGGQVLAAVQGIDMPTVTLAYKSIVEACHFLKQQGYEQLVDLCGVDLSEYPGHDPKAPRFQVVYHLLSVEHNRRIRLKVPVNERDLVGSVTEVWPTANWFERECFDMYGVLFVNHPDLRRLLTDYGFEGHPLRKDFPVTGRVEMFFDDAQWRCVYKPNKLENRVLIPKTFPGVDRG